MPPGGLGIRANDLDFLGQEMRLHEYKRDAASAYIRANGLNRIIYSGGANAKIGILTVGKNYLDVRQALDDIGIDEARANQIGVRLFKVACPWPFDREDMAAFVDGLEMVIVVEEKRSLLESQLREALYGSAQQPVVVGKRDERGDWLFPVKGALDPNDIAVAVGERVIRVIGHAEDIDAKVKRIRQFQSMLATVSDVSTRTPYFCSGCPHNSSTKVPEGSVAAAGSGVISCRCGWIGIRAGSPKWAARGHSGSARHHSPRVSISSRIWVTVPTTIPVCWRSVRHRLARQHYLQDPLQ
jgi:indolepyruvate ferredoxin oxidoreductase